MKWNQVEKFIIFVNITVKLQYDNSHIKMNIKVKSRIYLKLHNEYKISEINEKLTQQRVNSFTVIEKINRLIYKLKLSFTMHIHSIIFIA